MKGEGEGLQGVDLRALRIIQDERGAVLHMLRDCLGADRKIGEVYFSEVNPGLIKAWKRHDRMTQRFAVPVGRLRFAIFDGRPDSPTKGRTMVIEMGRPDHYRLLTVPPGLWYGFQNSGSSPALIANCPDWPHDPSESHTLPATATEIPFQWSL